MTIIKKYIMIMIVLIFIPGTVSCSSKSGSIDVAVQTTLEASVVKDITAEASATPTSSEADNGTNGSTAASTANSAGLNKGNSNEADDINETDNTNDADPSSNLKEKIICIDPGHQDKADLKKEPVALGASKFKAKCSGGAVGVKTKIPEYQLNLIVSSKLKDSLEKKGAKVVMTRTSNKVDISNVERAEIANKANADLFIRIHADGSNDTSIKGVSVLIPGNKYIKDKDLLDKSEEAGKIVLDNFVKATGAKSRGTVVRNDLTAFNWCRRPMVLIEMGYLSNEKEDELLNSESYQDNMVKGIVMGIEEYFK